MRTRRLVRCAGCGLPTSLCLCADLPHLETRTRLVLVVHQAELPKTSNTARLVAGSLTGVHMLVRGSRAPHAALPWPPTARRLVLFPAADARTLSAEDAARDAGDLTLIVPDGTWRQARRSCAREPLAQGAELVALPPGPPGRYLLRRAPADGALCTLEAVARALAIVESPTLATRLMQVLDEFVRRTQETRTGSVSDP